MNDLLHELHASACLYARDLHRESGDVVAWEQCMAEKFAELIVRECAKFMDVNSGYNDSDGCWFPEPEDMLKHFGVEL